MSARDDYPCLREGAGIDEWDELYARMCDEIDRLREFHDIEIEDGKS